MTPLRTRTQFLDMAAANAPTAACAEVIRKQGASVFRARNGTGDIGWIAAAKGQLRHWLIALWCDEAHRRWRCEYLTELPAHAIEVKGERL